MMHGTALEMLRESEERFHACFAQSAVGMGIVTLDGHFVRVNSAFCKMMGYCEREMLGAQFKTLLHPDYQVASLEHHRRLVNGECSSLIAEKVFVDKQGLPIEVQVSVSLIRDSLGRPARFLSLYEDIRSRKRAEQSLRESEERYRLLFDANPNPILVCDVKDGMVLAANQATLRHYGYSLPELLKMSVKEMRPPEDLPKLIDILNTLREGTPLLVNSRHRKKDGSIFEAEVVCRPLVYEGRPAYIVAITDLSERRRTEELERERGDLKGAVSAMERVLGVVSHELRTPLAGLMAMCDFLLSPESRGTPEADGFLRSINEEVIRMSDTVDHVLEAARLNSGRAKWNWGEVEIETVCREAIATTRPLVDESRVALRVRVDPRTRIMRGDAGAVRRLILNLLSNARKFTTDGSIELSVSPEGEAGELVQICVRDTGPGIPPAILGRLGEAFALNSGVVGANHVSGTGLGLAICKGIAEAHGGHMRFDSQQGQGAIVTAILRADLPAAANLTQEFLCRDAESGRATAA
jgi:PAS domain S-box-containing protein